MALRLPGLPRILPLPVGEGWGEGIRQHPCDTTRFCRSGKRSATRQKTAQKVKYLTKTVK
ncbi:hypothetical protein ENTCAN_07215 [Enterobacter cancerogenus ATCC 35316]|nr:hypothetical protein ENTCAN_07215 [Enterobacter cancerogenus ATCC 35316]